ncbi:MAG: hypothetical protein QOG16_1400 [Actinomycetota bacterium]|nr:hypothetical protein [Actinomycetota bacterium]
MPEIFVLIPAYNVGEQIQGVIGRIPVDYRKNVIVVDDGSSDDTAARVAELEDVTLVKHEHNQGYGGAQRTLYREAQARDADVAVMLHADGGHRPEELHAVLTPILEGSAEMVIGSRILGILDGERPRLTWSVFKKGRDSEMPTFVFLANIFLSQIQNFCYGSQLASFHDGFRALTADVLAKIPYGSLGTWYLYDTEFLVAAHERGVTAVQVPVSTFYPPGSASVGGRNIRYGLAILKHALAYRFGRKRSGADVTR